MTNFYRINTLGNANNDALICVEDYVKGLEMEAWRVSDGVSVCSTWPRDATIRLRKTSGRRLTDVLGTTKNKLFVSPRFRGVLEQFVPAPAIEFLPVTLLDHRGRVVAKDYAIANPLGTFDCLDLSASDVLWHPNDPGKLVHVSNPILSAKKVEDPPAMFRIQDASENHVVTSELAKALYAAEMTNLYWDKLEVR